jgi:hypothetical protein
MKLISAAIALLASVTVVTSLPVYGSSSSTEYSPTSTYDHYDHREDVPEPTESTSSTSSTSSTTSSDWPTTTPEPYCEGFNITSQTDPEITWVEDSLQEVQFNFTGSKIDEVEYVDLVKYDDKKMVDEWATGPWNSSDPRTGLHPVHPHRGYDGYYQFLVYATTAEDHHHCKYLSGKFLIIPKDDDHSHDDSHDDSLDYQHLEPYTATTSSSTYESTTSSSTYESTTTTPAYGSATTTSDPYNPTDESTPDDGNDSPYGP